MQLRNACFIGYRHAQQDLMRRFVEEFHESLSCELELLVELPVYRDQLRLQGGDFYNEALAKNLCQSVCMIMIFTPTYFSAEHPYCAREYAAMSKLEVVRLRAGDLHGLIIPVILRGFDQCPEEIRSKRHVYKFDHFTLSEQKLSKNKNFNIQIKEMAETLPRAAMN